MPKQPVKVVPDKRFNTQRTKGKTAPLPKGYKPGPDKRHNLAQRGVRGRPYIPPTKPEAKPEAVSETAG